jgi:hypothetical protein
MELGFIRRIENMPLYVFGLTMKSLSDPKSKLEKMLADLDEELCAGQAPTDFKAKIDATYQDITSEYNYEYELS